MQQNDVDHKHHRQRLKERFLQEDWTASTR